MEVRGAFCAFVNQFQSEWFRSPSWSFKISNDVAEDGGIEPLFMMERKAYNVGPMILPTYSAP
jgi:hypothetical protein